MSIETPEQLNGHTPPPPRDNTFRPGKGGQLTPEWADWMLAYWYNASRSNKRPSFGEALKTCVDHFMMSEAKP